MKKKQRPKKTREEPAAKPDSKRDVAKAASFEDESPGQVDYGGLPDRDLKKNLGGCG